MEPLGLIHGDVKAALLFDSSGRSLPTESLQRQKKKKYLIPISIFLMSCSLNPLHSKLGAGSPYTTLYYLISCFGDFTSPCPSVGFPPIKLGDCLISVPFGKWQEWAERSQNIYFKSSVGACGLHPRWAKNLPTSQWHFWTTGAPAPHSWGRSEQPLESKIGCVPPGGSSLPGEKEPGWVPRCPVNNVSA